MTRTGGVDTIVLAAGKNERLSGFVAPYMKPLLLVNGQPLIVDIVRRLPGTAVIVVAPENALQVTQVLLASKHVKASSIRIVVQPEASGPVNAIWAGLPYTTTHCIGVVCADNVIPDADLEQVLNALHPGGICLDINDRAAKDALRICTSFVEDADAARRFTTVAATQGVMFHREGDPHPFHLGLSQCCCWLGPFAAPRAELTEAVRRQRVFKNTSMNFVLNDCAAHVGRIVLIEGACKDIGVPEALPHA